MNRILFIGMKPKCSIKRMVESELERWISQEKSPLVAGPAEYQVKIEKEEVFPFYRCSIEVGFGACRLKAQEGAKTLQAALSHALRRMRVVTTPRKNNSSSLPLQSVA